MTANLLQKWKDKLFPTGTAKTAATVDPGHPRYSDSEIDSLKQQRTQANAAAREEIQKRGKKINPRIAAARAAGANV
jgi:hypothetical protein